MESLDEFPKKERYHVTKDGKRIKLSDMTDSHLANTIALLERKASKGVIVTDGGGFTSEDMWFEQYTIYGREALEHLNYYKYIEEQQKRWQHQS